MIIKYSFCLFLLSPNQQVRIFLEQTVSVSPTQLLLKMMEEKIISHGLQGEQPALN